MTTFAERLYMALPAEGNLFFSPASVESALGRAAIGARGNTRQQMLEGLGWSDGSDEALADRLDAMERALTKSRDVTVEVANRIWAEQSYRFSPTFMQLMQQFAGMETADFLNNYDGERLNINRWVEQMTHDRIRDLLAEGSLDASTRMVLVNAIYFLGKWQYAFPKEETYDSSFYPADGGSVQIPFMNQTATFGYTGADAYQALSMPYRGGLSRLVVLPTRGTSLREVEQPVANQGISAVAKNLRQQKVEVYFPKTELGWGTFKINSALMALGIEDAFSQVAADFTGIDDGQRDLYIDGVYHKAWYKDDEEGTEAAAATAEVAESRSMGPSYPVFIANRPYMHMILAPNGQVMFMGRVTDPTKE